MFQCYLNHKQKEAARMCNLDKVAFIGAGAYMTWTADKTQAIVNSLKEKMPEHASRSIPYHSLICKVITAHRSPE